MAAEVAPRIPRHVFFSSWTAPAGRPASARAGYDNGVDEFASLASATHWYSHQFGFIGKNRRESAT